MRTDSTRVAGEEADDECNGPSPHQGFHSEELSVSVSLHAVLMLSRFISVFFMPPVTVTHLRKT